MTDKIKIELVGGKRGGDFIYVGCDGTQKPVSGLFMIPVEEESCLIIGDQINNKIEFEMYEVHTYINYDDSINCYKLHYVEGENIII